MCAMTLASPLQLGLCENVALFPWHAVTCPRAVFQKSWLKDRRVLAVDAPKPARFFRRIAKPPVETKSTRPFGRSEGFAYSMTYPSTTLVPGRALEVRPTRRRKLPVTPASPGVPVQEATDSAVERVRELLTARAGNGLPTDAGAMQALERELHQDVAKECLDRFVGAVLQAAVESDAVIVEMIPENGAGVIHKNGASPDR